MEQVDVVIIGSGYGGAITAARLAAGGKKVVVLERGVRKGTADLKQSDSLKYIESVIDVVVSTNPAVPVSFRTGKLVGGASIPMDGAHYRVPRTSFERSKEANGRPYWPEIYSREYLNSYYDKAEPMLGIRQFEWNEIAKTGGLFAKMLHAYDANATCERARLNYTDCIGCGFCAQGCIYDKKVTLLHHYIPLAEQHGAEFRTEAEVDHLEPPKNSATGVYTVFYKRNGAPQQISGTRVIVACGGVYSAPLLLRSKTYLPNLSGHVGENFNNNGEHDFIGILPPEFDDLNSYDCFKGSDNAALMSFNWFESDGFTLHPGGGLEASVLATKLSAVNHPVLPPRAWGMDYKRFAETIYPHRIIAFSALGLADGHRAIAINPDGTPKFDNRDRTAYDKYRNRVNDIVFDMGKKTGVTIVEAVPPEQAGTTSAHLLSACRMADKKENGVVDADCQVFGYENLYVCDASVLPYALGVNPALTISAIAERTAEQILAQG